MRYPPLCVNPNIVAQKIGGAAVGVWSGLRFWTGFFSFMVYSLLARTKILRARNFPREPFAVRVPIIDWRGVGQQSDPTGEVRRMNHNKLSRDNGNQLAETKLEPPSMLALRIDTKKEKTYPRNLTHKVGGARQSTIKNVPPRLSGRTWATQTP